MVIELLAGGGLVLLGGAIGRWMPGRKRRTIVQPICGCRHHHSFHDPATGECHDMMYVGSSGLKSSHYTPCTCRQYSGPEPLPELYAREITGE